MNEKSARLNILDGFLIRLLVSLFSIIHYLAIRTDFMFTSGYSTLNIILNVLGFLGTAIVVAGFVKFYLIHRNKLDIFICIGFGALLITYLISIFANSLSDISVLTYILSALGYLFMMATFLWAYKLYRRKLPRAAIAAICGLICFTVSGLINAYILSYIISIVGCAAHVFAAYSDFATD